MCSLYIYIDRASYITLLLSLVKAEGGGAFVCAGWKIQSGKRWEEIEFTPLFVLPSMIKKNGHDDDDGVLYSSYREGEVLLFFFFPSQPEDDAVALLTAPSTSRVKTNKTTRASEVTHRPGRSARSAAASISTNAAALGKLK